MTRHFAEVSVSEAVNYKLPHPDIVGPLTSMGEPCPWPWDPIQLKGQPIGQYHCPYCGEMVIAGIDHIDYREEGDDVG